MHGFHEAHALHAAMTNRIVSVFEKIQTYLKWFHSDSF